MEVKLLDENQAAKPVDLCVYLVQAWCIYCGKDRKYANNGQITVNSIERMDRIFPHGRGLQLPRTIRSQKFILSSIRRANAYRRTNPLSYGCVRDDIIPQGVFQSICGNLFWSC